MTADIYPKVAGVRRPQVTYVKFLYMSGFHYADDASFLWDQPLAGDTLSANSNASPDSGKSGSSRAGSSSTIPANRTVCLAVVVERFVIHAGMAAVVRRECSMCSRTIHGQ